MDKKFWIVLVIIVFMCGGKLFTQDSLILPGILRSNIIIMVLIALFLLYGYGYTPITQIGQKIKLYFFLTLILILIGFQIYSALPPSLSETEREYIEHLDRGYSLFQNRKYEDALNEYEIAENIYREDSRL